MIKPFALTIEKGVLHKIKPGHVFTEIVGFRHPAAIFKGNFGPPAPKSATKAPDRISSTTIAHKKT